MTKVEASTLEEAYTEASNILECSISELQYEVVQHPSKGILGFMKKTAIIIAVCKDKGKEHTLPTEEESVASEILATVQKDTEIQTITSEEVVEDVEIKEERDTVLDSFFEPESKERLEENDVSQDESVVYDELGQLIESQLFELLENSCFDIDVVEVDVRDNTALIFIDGEDAALLIGKEGYRYNALSYMLFNWLHTKYELFIKVEIAEFLTTQQEMIRSYIKPVIENVKKNGKAKTRFLDGILVQIALEQLREQFPDKYVAVKTTKEGKKFVVINEFNTPSKSNN